MLSQHPPVFRFAPSPNGALHLGHAYSALLNQQMAVEANGRFLLRIEDIDLQRCTPALEAAMLDDLRWLGLVWEEPPRRQSKHLETYRKALDVLRDAGLAYPAFMSRAEIKAAVTRKEESGMNWPRDPDGQPHYPGDEREWSPQRQRQMSLEKPRHAWRLDMAAAMRHAGDRLVWSESGAGPDGSSGEIVADPSAWGDVVIARSDIPTSYHLAVVIDDAGQSITHVVRGRDLFHATSVHRLLQVLLGLPAPHYHHHDLILTDDGRKLSKSARDTSLQNLRDAGLTPADIRRMIGL